MNKLTQKEFEDILNEHYRKVDGDTDDTDDTDDLCYADFTDTDLSGINMEGLNLSGISFNGANLERCNLERADIRDCNFKGAYLRGARLDSAKANGYTGWEGADLSQATFKGVVIKLNKVKISSSYLTFFLDNLGIERID